MAARKRQHEGPPTSSSNPKPPKRSRDHAASERVESFSVAEAGASQEFRDVEGLDAYRLDMAGADVFYVPDFVSHDVANVWYERLRHLETWYRPTLKMYGRTFPQSRLIAAYATRPNLTLRYSGSDVIMNYPYPPVLADIQSEVEKKIGVKFNHCMLNWYEDGSVHIGAHRDNLENRVIASVSVGAERTFVMQHHALKPRKSGSLASPLASAPAQESKDPASVEKRKWLLANGSLVVMQGDTQRNWKHEIPKEPKIKEGRISLTFRQLIYDK